MNFNFLLLQLLFLIIPCSSFDNSTELSSNYQTDCQVKKYLQNANFPENSLSTMVCISKYESSFNCDANNINTDIPAPNYLPDFDMGACRTTDVFCFPSASSLYESDSLDSCSRFACVKSFGTERDASRSGWRRTRGWEKPNGRRTP